MNDKELENVARRKAFIECGKPAGFDTGWNAGADWVECNSQAHTAETLDSMTEVASAKVNTIFRELEEATGLRVIITEKWKTSKTVIEVNLCTNQKG